MEISGDVESVFNLPSPEYLGGGLGSILSCKQRIKKAQGVQTLSLGWFEALGVASRHLAANETILRLWICCRYDVP